MKFEATTKDWSRIRDDLMHRLRDHAASCLLCDCGPLGLTFGLKPTGARIHSSCEPGIVLLTEWHLAKCYAQDLHTIQPPPQSRGTSS